MVILLCYTSAISEVIYADFNAKILDWNFRLVNENSRILAVVFVSKLNFSYSFRYVDENHGIFVVVVVFVTKINLLSSAKIFFFVIVDEKNTVYNMMVCVCECVWFIVLLCCLWTSVSDPNKVWLIDWLIQNNTVRYIYMRPKSWWKASLIYQTKSKTERN